MTSRALTLDSPLGPVRIVAEDGALVAVTLRNGPEGPPDREGATAEPVLREASEQLAAWFRGDRQDFELPLRPRGTPFQLAVWRELVAIPYGETRTYGDIAARLGRPSATRAVGAANGRNPLWIVVPCHRVIGASGALTGYAAGLDCKRWLLEHERAVLQRAEGFRLT